MKHLPIFNRSLADMKALENFIRKWKKVSDMPEYARKCIEKAKNMLAEKSSMLKKAAAIGLTIMNLGIASPVFPADMSLSATGSGSIPALSWEQSFLKSAPPGHAIAGRAGHYMTSLTNTEQKFRDGESELGKLPSENMFEIAVSEIPEGYRVNITSPDSDENVATFDSISLSSAASSATWSILYRGGMQDLALAKNVVYERISKLMDSLENSGKTQEKFTVNLSDEIKRMHERIAFETLHPTRGNDSAKGRSSKSGAPKLLEESFKSESMEKAVFEALVKYSKTEAPKEELVQYAKHIMHYSGIFSLDPRIVTGVLLQESAGLSNAVSPTGCVGLMQISYSVHKDQIQSHFSAVKSRKDLFNPKLGIGAGCMVLRNKLLGSRGDMEKALWSYLGGGGDETVYVNNVLRWGKEIDRSWKALVSQKMSEVGKDGLPALKSIEKKAFEALDTGFAFNERG